MLQVPAAILPSTITELPKAVVSERRLANIAHNDVERMKRLYRPAQLAESLIVLADASMISREAVVHIIYPEIVMEKIKNAPHQTLYDPLMGPSDIAARCMTCKLEILECPGHFGEIKFPFKLYHFLFFDSLLTLLQIICRNPECRKNGEASRGGYLIMSELDIQNSPAGRKVGDVKMSTLAKESDKVPCHRCGKKNHKLLIDQSRKSPHKQTIYQSVDGVGQPLAIDAEGTDGNGTNSIGNSGYGGYNVTTLSVLQMLERIDPNAQELSPLDGNDPEKERIKRVERERRWHQLSLMGYLVIDRQIRGTNPRSYIMQNMYVPAPKFRPAAMVNGSINHHPLTNQLSEIIRRCNMWYKPTKVDDQKNIRIDIAKKLQIFYSSASTTGSRSKARVTLVGILSGKHGRFRRDAMGKRIDYTSRTVISPGPQLPIGTIGYPAAFAAQQSVEVPVIELNKALMQETLQRGTLVSVEQRGRTPLRDEALTAAKDKILLQVGDKVRRPLQNGDITLENRAPTLQRHSTLAHKIRLHPGNQKQIPLTVVAGYNADFDGDEMGSYVPQTLEGQVEAQEILNSRLNLGGPRNSAPVAGPFYDALSGVFILTHPDLQVSNSTFFNALMMLDVTEDISTLFSRLARAGLFHPEVRADAEAMLGGLEVPYAADVSQSVGGNGNLTRSASKVSTNVNANDGINGVNGINMKNTTNSLIQSASANAINLSPGTNETSNAPDVTKQGDQFIRQEFSSPGRALFSALLPGNFNYHNKDKDIEIRHGILIRGRPDKDIIGQANNSITHHLIQRYGEARGAQFIDELTFMTDFILAQLGLTVSLQDLAYDTLSFRNQVLQQRIALQQTSLTMRPPVQGWTADPMKLKQQELHEREMDQIIANSKNTLESAVNNSFGLENNFALITKAKTKGNLANFTQMIGGIGQSSLNKKRMEPLIGEQERCSIYYGTENYGVEARGYCYNSLTEGMSPADYLMHQNAGRESLLDQSLKTGNVGALRRKVLKSAENLIMLGDYSTRNNGGIIFQQIYGAALDPTKLIPVGTAYGSMHSFINIGATIEMLNDELDLPHLP